MNQKIKIVQCDDISDPSSMSASQFRYQMSNIRQRRPLRSDSGGPLFRGSLTASQSEPRRKKSKKVMFDQARANSSFLNQNKLGLRNIIGRQKVQVIVRNFAKKLQRNVSNSSPVQYQPYIKQSDSAFLNRSGFSIPNWFNLTFGFLSIIQILALCFVYTLSLVFDSFINMQFISILQTFSVCFYTIEIMLNLFSTKTVEGRKITALGEIFSNYFKSKMLIDLLCLILLVVDINTSNSFTKYFRLGVIFKIAECLEKMEKIENFFVNNFYREQYWGLVKVFLTNFAFAHALAVLLLAMSLLSDTDNWLMKVHAEHAVWYEKYAWAYYWGSTIMFTVGFGDLAASNYQEAICLTLIETVSCILLAYNINCIGALISNIRSQNIEKNKNFKIMRRLAEANNIKEDLEWKVRNFIDYSDKMKKKFGFEEEKKFIGNLPSELKAQFLKQSNIKIFQSIGLFSNFTERTLLSLAQKIQVKITHPEQIVLRSEENNKMLILKQGKVAYCTKLIGSDYSGVAIDFIEVDKKQKPKLLCLDLNNALRKGSRFNIKSLKYSMIYFIGMDEVVQIMKENPYDFETYCEMKDKSKHILDEFQLIDCDTCKTKHSKMNCPKIHYCPIPQMVVYKHLQKIKKSTNDRMRFARNRTVGQIAYSSAYQLLRYYKKMNECVHRRQKKNQNRMNTSKASRNDSYAAPPHAPLQENSKDNFVQENLSNYIRNVIIENDKVMESCQFQWDLECDVAQNFKFYFANGNPGNLATTVVFKGGKNGNLDSNGVIPPSLTDLMSSLAINYR